MRERDGEMGWAGVVGFAGPSGGLHGKRREGEERERWAGLEGEREQEMDFFFVFFQQKHHLNKIVLNCKLNLILGVTGC